MSISQSDNPNDSLRSKMVSGSAWMVAINVIRRGIGVVSTVILARLLPPEDFGLVAMASVLMNMLQVVTEFGFDVALIQKQQATRTHYDTAWTFNVIFAVSSALVLIALAYPAGAFYDEPRVTPIILALALGVAMRGFENIGIVNFRKNLEYHREFIFFTSIKVCAFIVTITIAVATGNYWALVIGTLTSRATALVLSYRMQPFRPRFSIASRRELFSFSIWMFLNNVLLFVRTRSADLIVGRILGARSLGLLTIGQEISNIPSEELVAPINRAVFPGYSRISADRFRLRSAFLNVLGVIALVGIPSGVGIALVASSAVPVLLGQKWLDVIPLIEVLALVSLITAMSSNIGTSYIALGKPKINVLLQILSAVILLPLAVILAESMGIIGIVYAYLIANGTAFFANLLVSQRLLGVTITQLFFVVLRPAIAAAFMAGAVLAVKSTLEGVVPEFLRLLTMVGAGALVYALAIIVLWILAGRPRGVETVVLEQVDSIPVLRSLAASLRSRA